MPLSRPRAQQVGISNLSSSLHQWATGRYSRPWFLGLQEEISDGSTKVRMLTGTTTLNCRTSRGLSVHTLNTPCSMCSRGPGEDAGTYRSSYYWADKHTGEYSGLVTLSNQVNTQGS